MASIYDLKPRFQALLRPVTRKLASFGVTANQVTVAALVLSVLVGGGIALFPERKWPLLIVPGFLLIRMALNAIDGMLAREHGMKSDLGLILNELGDVAADTAVYLPFALVPGFRPALVVLTVVLSMISEMAGVVAVQIGGGRRYDGPLGKSDRAFLFGLLGLLAGVGLNLEAWLDGIFAVACLLLVLTIFNRSRRALRAATEESGKNDPGEGESELYRDERAALDDGGESISRGD